MDATGESGTSKNPDSARLISVYRKRAKRYDQSAILLYLLGFRHKVYRRLAIECLGLKAGDTVVDLGCGTGLNFALLYGQVGPSGRIIGVDLTDAMLKQASDRVSANNWVNVELIKSDIIDYIFLQDIQGIISTFALTLSPSFDEVIRRGALALLSEGRFVVLDFKRPRGWLMDKIAPLLARLLTGPFGGTIDMASRRPWESLKKYLLLRKFADLYCGGAYIAIGEKPLFRADDVAV